MPSSGAADIFTFLLTRPSRDVTKSDWSKIIVISFLLTRPSRDVTRCPDAHGHIGFRFLLTRPSRDVTARGRCCDRNHGFLLTRPSRDVTHRSGPFLWMLHISTHTSLAGRDPDFCGPGGWNSISTHTSLAGRDILTEMITSLLNDFYSHVPRGT